MDSEKARSGYNIQHSGLAVEWRLPVNSDLDKTENMSLTEQFAQPIVQTYPPAGQTFVHPMFTKDIVKTYDPQPIVKKYDPVQILLMKIEEVLSKRGGKAIPVEELIEVYFNNNVKGTLNLPKALELMNRIARLRSPQLERPIFKFFLNDASTAATPMLSDVINTYPNNICPHPNPPLVYTAGREDIDGSRYMKIYTVASRRSGLMMAHRRTNVNTIIAMTSNLISLPCTEEEEED